MKRNTDNVVTMYKKRGETPLEALNRLKKESPVYKDEAMTYAGRLDPMAEGLLLVLIGDKCKEKDQYLGLEKEYVFEVLFGFETDTYDILGLVTGVDKKMLTSGDIEGVLPRFLGKQQQQYPPFSSKPVDGKPLFMWAKEGKLNEIKIPEHEVSISSLVLESTRFIKGDYLKKYIEDNVALISGDDFRQKEIIERWKESLDDKNKDEYFVAKLRMTCGSGTYVRSLVQTLGERLGVSALTLNIVRTRVGDYSV